MEQFTILKITPSKYQINLSDSRLIYLNAITRGVLYLGSEDIEAHQKNLNFMLECVIKHHPDLAGNIVKSNNFVNEAFLFLATNVNNAMVINDKIEPICNEM